MFRLLTHHLPFELIPQWPWLTSQRPWSQLVSNYGLHSLGTHSWHTPLIPSPGSRSLATVRSVSVGFFYIAHYRTLHIALVFCLLVFFNYYHSWRIKMSIAIFGLMHWLKHRITRKLLKTDRYMLRGVWQALNCLSIHATYCVIIAGTSPGETKMWAAVRKNGDFLHLWFE